MAEQLADVHRVARRPPDRRLADRDRSASARRAFGRYWGATEPIRCLHFEACYYQPLAWCIANGYGRFEGGAQGEHKMARGLLPVQTWSAHWLAHPQFARGGRRFLAREGAGVENYLDELNERKPFKTTSAAAGKLDRRGQTPARQRPPQRANAASAIEPPCSCDEVAAGRHAHRLGTAGNRPTQRPASPARP